MTHSLHWTRSWLVAAMAAVLALAASAQAQTEPVQKRDEAYTALMKKHLVDPRFTTELVDHMPASDTVPSPLKFFGRIPGTPGELTYAYTPGEEQDGDAYGGEGLELGVAVRMLLVRRAGGYGDANQPDDVGSTRPARALRKG